MRTGLRLARTRETLGVVLIEARSLLKDSGGFESCPVRTISGKPALERDHIEFAGKVFGDLPETTFRGFARGLDSVLARLRELLAA